MEKIAEHRAKNINFKGIAFQERIEESLNEDEGT